MKEKRRKSFTWMSSAIYLSIAAFVAKGLSALYKVPYQNITGDTGFYIYQQIYPLYGVAFVLGTYGFPLVISKMLAENDDGECAKRNQLITLTVALFVLNSILGTCIILFAKNIAIWMGDENLTNGIRWLGAPFFLIPFLSISRGYFQSGGNNMPSSFSQVVEQFVRVIVILFVAFVAMKYFTPYEAGVSAGLGAFAGGLAGIVVMFYFWKKEMNAFVMLKGSYTLPKNWRRDIKDLYRNGFLVSISAMTLVLFQIIDSFTLFRFLLHGGLSPDKAAVLKGIYDRGWPIIQLGAVVTTVFSYASIPFLTNANKEGNRKEVVHLIKQSVKVCLVFGGAATVGLMLIMPHLNIMLFVDNEGVETLMAISLSVFFGALFMTIAALFHGIGKAVIGAYILCIGVIIKGVGNVFLVPHFHIFGAAICTSVSLFFIAIFSIFLLKNIVHISFYDIIFWLKWALSLLCMAMTVFIYKKSILILFAKLSVQITRSLHTVIAISSVFLGAAIFIVMIWRLRLFTKNEWESLPIVSKIFPY